MSSNRSVLLSEPHQAWWREMSASAWALMRRKEMKEERGVGQRYLQSASGCALSPVPMAAFPAHTHISYLANISHQAKIWCKSRNI